MRREAIDLEAEAFRAYMKSLDLFTELRWVKLIDRDLTAALDSAWAEELESISIEVDPEAT